MTKRIVICCDGMWNIPDKLDRGKVCPSNVTKVALAVASKQADGTEQKVFYDKGVGTGGVDRIRGGTFGMGLSQNIEDAYRFVIDNYEPGVRFTSSGSAEVPTP
jgi:uncharacterized protein (DUF2235 family)